LHSWLTTPAAPIFSLISVIMACIDHINLSAPQGGTQNAEKQRMIIIDSKLKLKCMKCKCSFLRLKLDNYIEFWEIAEIVLAKRNTF
jgi:hypothetical protein